ncbi:nematode cuticle collagen domain protein [Dictyocaulus viviparus]|uniref:Nematode cuticle collagen domain protein n=1 Tax=Dictyocaulus viviparus TaxID=29172 RepID=A0A0D8YDK9_DICVI|nr:nematode cuticle collagen domain protein [Dictyocaulus viviparus]
MPDGATLATVLTISISVGMIVTCGIVAKIICSDINEFYEDSMKEFKVFQVLTDDAWKEVMSMETRPSEMPTFDSIIGRTKREIQLPDFCSCMHESTCPPGPPGAPGLDGEDGGRSISC